MRINSHHHRLPRVAQSAQGPKYRQCYFFEQVTAEEEERHCAVEASFCQQSLAVSSFSQFRAYEFGELLVLSLVFSTLGRCVLFCCVAGLRFCFCSTYQRSCFADCTSCCNCMEPTHLVSVSLGNCVAMFFSSGGVEFRWLRLKHTRNGARK